MRSIIFQLLIYFLIFIMLIGINYTVCLMMCFIIILARIFSHLFPRPLFGYPFFAPYPYSNGATLPVVVSFVVKFILFDIQDGFTNVIIAMRKKR